MKKFLLGVIFVIAAFSTNAQLRLGVSTGNWSGLNSLYINPANIADNRNRFCIELFSANVGVDNNVGTINTGNVFKQFVNKDSVQINKLIAIQNDKALNLMAPNVDVRVLNMMYSISHRQSIAFEVGLRGMNQFSNFDQTLFRILTGTNTINLSQNATILNLQNFKWMTNAWSQIGLTYAAVILEKPKHQLKVGVTVKYLGGLGYAGLKGNELTANYNVYKNPNNNAVVDSSSLDVTSSNVDYASNIIKSQDQLKNGLSATDIVNYLFGKKDGFGIGGDIGIVYEFRPGYPKEFEYEMDGRNHMDFTQNMYKLRLSVSVTDIGSILYNNNDLTANVNGVGHISSNDAGTNFKNFSDLRNFAVSHGFTFDTSNSKGTRVYLPTALIASVDYHIAWRFYANVTYMGDLTNHQNFGNNYYNQVSLTPRYDSRNFSLAVPVTYSELTNTIKAGVGFRYSGFFIGSDDMLALFNNNQYGFNIYCGAFVPIGKKKIKDFDHDKVSDKNDLCPTIPGDLSAHGCPDRDHDGVPDMDDRCPDDSGAVELQGCPDRDDDGIPDIDDKCPDVPGLEQFNGCPDRDHDGVPDNEDLCPDVPGLPQFHGCPDTDGDGVPDNEDLCPNVPGPVSNHGCPVEEKKKEPAAKAKPEKAPEAKADIKKKIDRSAGALEFETGKAVIKKTSFGALNEVVKILNDYPDSYMTIDGYTDNTGNIEKNMSLSGERADAVKDYFVKHGVPASRLISTGHGDTNPVAPNNTPQGRAKNRRVVMELKSK